MSKTIVVYCGAANCGAEIARKVVPNAAAEQCKALVPSVMICPNAKKKHAEYPAVHTRVEIKPGPKKQAAPAVESGRLGTPNRERASPTTPPPLPGVVTLDDHIAGAIEAGATLGIAHMGPTGQPETRQYDPDEIPAPLTEGEEDEAAAAGVGVEEDDTDDLSTSTWSGSSDGSDGP